jgi:hypothetical protein
MKATASKIMTLSCQLQTSCIKFNNNKLNTLQMYNIADKYRIVHRVVQCLSHSNLKILHNPHTAFRSFVKQSNDSNKTRSLSPRSLTAQNFICPSAMVRELPPFNKIWI